MASLTCTMENCERLHKARGLCRNHYMYAKRRGSTDAPRQRTEPGRALAWLRAVAAESDGQGCRLFPFPLAADGYPVIWLDGKNTKGSHVLLALTGKPWRVPLGPLALHSCDTPACLAPWHLSWGTNAENLRQMCERGRHRPRGKVPAWL